jgi:hypothetical protein
MGGGVQWHVDFRKLIYMMAFEGVHKHSPDHLGGNESVDIAMAASVDDALEWSLGVIWRRGGWRYGSKVVVAMVFESAARVLVWLDSIGIGGLDSAVTSIHLSEEAWKACEAWGKLVLNDQAACDDENRRKERM